MRFANNVYIVHQGGLGNILFQLSAGLYVAETYRLSQVLVTSSLERYTNH